MVPPKFVVLLTIGLASFFLDAVHILPGNLAQVMDRFVAVAVLALHWD
jgi:hypothetical protein